MLIGKQNKWARRRFLGGLGLGALAGFVPLLESQADPSSVPHRLILFQTATGTHLPSWRPSGTEHDWQLSEILEPLAAFKDRMIVVDGLDNAATPSLSSGHEGYATLWSGSRLSSSSGSLSPGRPTVDQIIADGLEDPGVFRSLHSGIRCFHEQTVIQKVAFWQGPSQPIYPIQRPRDYFDQLFAELALDPVELERRRQERQSVIDWVRDDLRRIEMRVSAADRHRLGQHLAAIELLEQQLGREVGANCEVPPLPPDIPEYTPNGSIPEGIRSMLDLLAMAFACDLTRVHTFQWASSPGGGTPTWLTGEPWNYEGSPVAMHDLSHDGSSEGRRNWTRVQTWNATNVRYLLEALAAIPEGDGTVLDHCTIVWASELSDGRRHWYRNVPVVIFDGPGGFETNRYLRIGDYEPDDDPEPDAYGTMPMNRLLVSLCHRMGLGSVQAVGDDEFGNGPVPGLELS